jgi:ssDNA-binding Zn-finger/Zn-ribbon topoisomerase 1
MGVAKNLIIEQELGVNKKIVNCPHCNNRYMQETQDQVAGFRDIDYDICPYCGKINGQSMQEEFYNYKL